MLRQCRTRRCRSWCPSYRKRAGDRRATGRAGNPWAGDPQGLAAVGKSESGSYRRDLSWVAMGSLSRDEALRAQALLAAPSWPPSLQSSPPEQLERAPQSGALGWGRHCWEGNPLLQVSPFPGDSPRREPAKPAPMALLLPVPQETGPAALPLLRRPGCAAPGQEMRPGGGASVSASFAKGSPSGSYLPSRQGFDCH